jgi:phospholipid/cholesterol/gamma-HCH transport system ATP-binding protein
MRALLRYARSAAAATKITQCWLDLGTKSFDKRVIRARIQFCGGSLSEEAMTVPVPVSASLTDARATPSRVVPAVVFDRVSFAFDEHVVLRDVSFSIARGSMRFLLGASGAGKSVMLKLILGLLRPDEGTIVVNGQRVDHLGEGELLRTRTDIGMVFQENALFDSLTVSENVGYRLDEETDMPVDQVRARVAEVLGFVGMGEYADRLPSELSGGQRRRVAIARAMASKPSLLLYDDPTTGLDPIIATTVDDEIVKLRDLEHVTSIVVTHQIRDAFYIATHRAIRHDGRVQIVDAEDGTRAPAEFMVLYNGRIHFQGSATELLASADPYLRRFLYMTLPPW